MEGAIPVTMSDAVMISGEMDPGAMVGMMAMLAGAGLILMLLASVMSIFSIVCFFRITKKVGGMSAWYQFVPFANVVYYWKLTGRRGILVVPLVVVSIGLSVSGFLVGEILASVLSVAWSLVFSGYLMMGLAERCGKNKWFGLWAIIPVVQLWVLWQLGAGPKKVPAVVVPENFSPADVAKAGPEESPMPEPVAHLQAADVPALVAPVPEPAPVVALTEHEQQQVEWIKQCVAGGFEKSALQTTLAEQSQISPEQFEKLWTAAQ